MTIILTILKALVSGGGVRLIGALATPAVLVFAWNVLGKLTGNDFYRVVTLAGLVLALAVAVGHFWKGGKLAKFRAYRGIGLALCILAVVATCAGLGMAMLETLRASRLDRPSPVHRRLQDAPAPSKALPPVSQFEIGA